MKNLIGMILVAAAVTGGALFIISRYGGLAVADSAPKANSGAEARAVGEEHEGQPGARGEEASEGESAEGAPEPAPAGEGPAAPVRLFEAVKEVVSPAVAAIFPEPASPAPKPAQASGRGPEKKLAPPPAAPPVRLSLPSPLQRVRFGMSPDQVAAAYPVAWQRQTRDTLTLVHYFNRFKTEEGRFEFRKTLGLQRIEVRLKVPEGANSADLYGKIQQDHQKRYGSLPDSRHNRWSDGRMTISLQRQPEYVAISYAAKK